MSEEPYVDTISQMVDDVRAGKMSRRKLMKILTAIGISTGGIGAIVAATSQTKPTHVSVKSTQQNSEHNMQLHHQHLTHQLQGNTNALLHDYAEYAIVEDSMYDQPFIGRAAIMARKGSGMMAIADLEIKVTNRVAQDHQVSVEWIASGTHTGDFPDLPATGRSFVIPGVTVVIRSQGKIIRESIYYNMDEVRRQLGPW